MKKTVTNILMLSLASSILVGCVNSDIDSSNYDATTYDVIDYNSDQSGARTLSSSEAITHIESNDYDNETEQSDDMIQYNGMIVSNTTDYENDKSKLNAFIQQYKGRVTNSNESIGDNYDSISNSKGRSWNATIEVASDDFSEMMDSLTTIGDIKSDTRNQIEVSDYISDLNKRIELLDTQIDNLHKILKDAKKVEDMITIQESIDSLLYEKESMVGSLKNEKRKVSFSQITFTLNEVDHILQKGESKTSFENRLNIAFFDMLNVTKYTIQELIIRLVYVFPLAVFIMIALIFSWLIHRLKRKHPQKTAEKQDLVSHDFTDEINETKDE